MASLLSVLQTIRRAPTRQAGLVLIAVLLAAGAVTARADTPPGAIPRRLFVPLTGFVNPLFAPRPSKPAPPPLAPTAAVPGIHDGGPGAECLEAARRSELAHGIPNELLVSIAKIESGRADGHGGVAPWPWSINVEGVDHVYDTKAAAIAAVTSFEAGGVRSIDVGCLQVNLKFHPDAFATLDDAFDPARNADYAGRFLNELFGETGSWEKATANYHSATPGLGDDYQRKVAAVWSNSRPTTLAMLPRAAGPALLPPLQTAPASPRPVGEQPTGRTPAALPATIGGPLNVAAGSIAPAGMPVTGAIPAGPVGRGLAAYRSAPVAVTSSLTARKAS